MSVLILNGSPSGAKGNCQILIRKISKQAKAFGAVQVLQLADLKWTAAEMKRIFAQLENAEAFIFVTGTYWDSWGSPLQKFLENVTALEGRPAFLGKPAAVFVLNHSVGGKAVLSRLQGVLSTLGCLIPPMSGMVYSWVNEELLKSKRKSEAFQDLWSLEDLADILENLNLAAQNKLAWKSWPVDRKNFRKRWLR